jgi:hypothetical protein
MTTSIPAFYVQSGCLDEAGNAFRRVSEENPGGRVKLVEAFVSQRMMTIGKS